MQAPRIMVVEDERIIALHLSQQLETLGYQVVGVVASGERALEDVRMLQPDVMLMDIQIEGELDGIETVARMPEDLQIPVVYLTAHSEEATLARARATRPYGYLLKPFAERELHATIQMVLERRTAEVALRESEERLRFALEAAEMGSWELDTSTQRLLRMGKADEIFGFASQVFSGTWEAFLDRVHEDDRALVSEAFDRVLEQSTLCQVEYRSLRSDRGMRWLKVQGKRFHAGASGGKRIIGVVRDVTERRAAEERLRQAATVLEAATDGILILDDQLRVLTVNQGYCAMTGYAEDELLGRRPHLLFRGNVAIDMREACGRGLDLPGQWRSEIQGRRKNGEPFPVLTNVVPVADTHEEPRYVAVFTDMTAVRKAEAELQRLAHYDPVTDLPNRLLALDRIQHALEREARRKGRVALLFVDLDHFKRINDTLGHDAGDELLRAIAQRMRESVRAEDTVARFGGDEFLVVLENVERSEDVGRVAEKLLAAIAQPTPVTGREVAISGSIGISFYPEDGDTREDLIRAADTAMYAAKELGRQSYSFHTAEMTNTARHHMALDQDLRRAVQRGELTLRYQPQISMRTGQIIGVEALLRWQHNAKGLLGADEVIPMAEKNGLILEMGQWALVEALRQAKEWLTSGLPPVRVAVNVSAIQVQRGRLLRAVTQALHTAGIPPDQLEIEITETTLQSEPDCLTALRELRRLGVTLAIDDFGIGYSCLGSLKTLPINRLKIDRAFVRDVPNDANDAAIVEAVVAMAHKLDLGVVAEGVETAVQEKFLRDCGCDAAQGYLYAHPMAPEPMAELLRAQLL